MSGIFEKVLADKESQERENRAWEARCEALEDEVRRLCERVERLEREKREGWAKVSYELVVLAGC